MKRNIVTFAKDSGETLTEAEEQALISMAAGRPTFVKRDGVDFVKVNRVFVKYTAHLKSE